MKEEIKLYVIPFEQDDPRRCTAEKLKRFGMVKFVKRPIGIVLTPFASAILRQGPEDEAIFLLKGVTAIDASWKRRTEWGPMYLNQYARRLPLLIAANPINYARPHLLSTAEALAAAVYIMGRPRIAEALLSKFKWGPNFLKLNRRALEIYRRTDDIVEAERHVMSNYAEIFRI
ncbi:MAG: DUF367 family protein [Nitrososphaeria archaeon]